MTKIEKLLAVLDLPEDEQITWLEDNGYENYACVDLKSFGQKLKFNCLLADLAFRLRDEVVNVSESSWSKAKTAVAKKWVDSYIELVKKACKIDLSDSYIGLVNAFFANEAKPIHWIRASLIAKELAE